MTSPANRREAVEQVCQTFHVSERRACRALEQVRSTQRNERVVVDDEAKLTQEIVRLASKYGRYGDRRVTELLTVTKEGAGAGKITSASSGINCTGNGGDVCFATYPGKLR